MEDIVFDFNAQDIYDDNIDLFGPDTWWPSSEQSDDYPGAGEGSGPFFLGFFAGITIETSKVILNLNGFEIKQSDIFYIHQRWFTCIELSTQYFLPGEGPISNFGGDPKYK